MSETWLVEVLRKDPAADPAAGRYMDAGISGVRLGELYELGPASREQAERLARELLADPLLDRTRVVRADDAAGAAEPGKDEAVLTVLRKDGVMDPVALTTIAAARDLGVPLERVRTARRVYSRGKGGPPPTSSLESLQRRLANPVVDRVLLGRDPLPRAARGQGAPTLRSEVPLRGLSQDELVLLSRRRTLALDAAEMSAIQAHYAQLGREPSDLELETLAQTWSEHCKHKTLAGAVEYVEQDAGGREVARKAYKNLLKETVFAATSELNLPHCLSVFQDNAGVITFDERHGVAVKVETHNHPSAIEPYGGSGTGVGGVIRDILGTGLGARPIMNLDVFCVGDLGATPEQVPPGSIHPKTLLEGVVAGVRDYGNRMGIPTLAGSVISEPRYAGNPLVYCGTVGLIPRERVEKAARPGDAIVVAGGRTGRDGIHGATFSSDALTDKSEVESGGAVQIGNAIAEKMVADVLLQVRDRGWVTMVTDCGAGGLSSAVGEMATGLGCEVDLSRVPLKYAGLAPWEVWISEAQERMVLAVPPEHELEVCAAFAAEDVEATVLGRFTDTGRLIVAWGETVIGDLELEFLHEGLPRQVRPATFTRPARRAFAWPARTDAGELLLRVLAAPSVCSKEWIVRQYDHEVQGGAALKPFVGVTSQGPSDAAAVAPVPGSLRGVVVSSGCNPRHGAADPWDMAVGAVDEALRNLVAAGGDPARAGILDNFSWGDCRNPERLGEMVRAAEACKAAALAYRVPFISGKDSLNNEYVLPGGKRVAIPGTLLVTAVGVVEDVTRLVSMDLKRSGSVLLLLGETRAELLGSHAAELLGRVAGAGADAPTASGGDAPQVDLARAPAVLAAAKRAIAAGGVRAAHDLSEGGLAVALAEMAFAGGIGAELELARVPSPSGLDDLTLLFSESPTRLLLEVDPAALPRVSQALTGVPWSEVGRTNGATRITVRGRSGALVLEQELARLERAWRSPLFDLYGGGT